MGSINKANIRKTWSYLKRNGLKKTYYAARERLEQGREVYRFEAVPEALWKVQREWSLKQSLRFSIVVPLYRTKKAYLADLLDSLEKQSYPHWELILADATEGDGAQGGDVQSDGAQGGDEKSGLEEILNSARFGQDDRIHYFRLLRNGGISENTNCGLSKASGDYVGLLDHDDVLTEDALYEMAAAITEAGKAAEESGEGAGAGPAGEAGAGTGVLPMLLYSDEDKCNEDRTVYCEPHRKEDFNLDLLLTNNYICHFLVMKRELIQGLGLRKAFDGAQDYDLVLRAVGKLMDGGGPGDWERQIRHVPKVLYHWRCHGSSTAENPGSKEYAYEAGRLAVEDFLGDRGILARASHMEHKGFYRVSYEKGPLEARRDLAAVGGRVLSGGHLDGGCMTEDGDLLYGTLPPGYSGYMHRAVLQQDAEALDIRNLEVREECRELFERIVGVPYRELPDSAVFDASTLPEGTDWRQISLELSRALRREGYRLLYSPERRFFWPEKEKQGKRNHGT